MRPTRPYLLRAFYEWIVDNQFTPYIAVNTTAPGIKVPVEYSEKDQMILNISMNAVRDLQLGNESITFNARFSGISYNIYVPISAVLAIYAKENHRGMVFSEDDLMGIDSDSHDSSKNKTKDNLEKKKPNLTVVK